MRRASSFKKTSSALENPSGPAASFLSFLPSVHSLPSLPLFALSYGPGTGPGQTRDQEDFQLDFLKKKRVDFGEGRNVTTKGRKMEGNFVFEKKFKITARVVVW